MKNDRELIDIWMTEFEKLTGETHSPTQDKCFDYGEAPMWNGFLLAKRSMPVIELPKMDCFDNMNGFDVAESIEAAGYKYTIKGE